jgi:hypothetical protein
MHILKIFHSTIKHQYKTIAVFLGISMLVNISSLSASVTVITEKQQFLNSTGAKSLTGQVPNIGYVGKQSKLGSLIFNSDHGIDFGTASEFPPDAVPWSSKMHHIFGGQQIAFYGPEDFTINSEILLFSIGFEFLEPSLTRSEGNPSHPYQDTTNLRYFTKSSFNIDLLYNGNQVGKVTFNYPLASLDEPVFFGMISTNSFNTIVFTESASLPPNNQLNKPDDTETKLSENEFFGQFFGTAAPEPTTYAFLSSALLIVAAIRFYKKNSV